MATLSVYISGAMTGLPDCNYPAFHAKATELRAKGYVVRNPAENFDGDTTLPRYMYLKEDIKNLLSSDRIVFLAGFEKSAGALLEALVARECNILTLGEHE